MFTRITIWSLIMDFKQEILNLLFTSQNNWISGDELAQKFNISRTMVWKYIKALENDGFQIKSKRSAGYQLETGYALNNALIERQLDQSVDVQTFKTINSTNTYLKEYLGVHSLTQPLAVITEKQTKGYGRFKRDFYSPDHSGIYLSLAVPLNNQPLNPSLVTTSIAIGVIHALQKFFPEQNFSVKWVNDLYIGHKKIAGILTEATADLESLAPTELVIGVGINLTTQDFPKELKSKVQAISDRLPADLNTIAAELINNLLSILTDYEDGHYLQEYRQRLNLMGKQIDMQVGSELTHGEVVDLSNDGGLVVKDKQNHLQTYYSGEVQKIYF